MSGILLVNSFLSSGASFTASAELADHLRALNFQVICASSARNRMLRLADMVSTCILRRSEFQAANVAVFSGNAFLWAEITTLLLSWLRKPVVLTLHGGSLPEFASRNPRRFQRVLKHAAAVTAPSEYLKDQLKPYYQGIQIIPNGLDISAYPFRSREKATPRLIWLRAFHEMYNPMLVVPIIANIQQDFPDVRISVIGPVKDHSREKTIQAAKALSVTDRMTIIPGVPKTSVPTYLNSADIFLNTTSVDNQPVSVLEAMACGLCVVSTNVGGLPYLIRSGVEGILCPPDDDQAMADAVRRILRDPQLASHLSSNARVRAETHDWHTVLEKWEKLFASIIE